MKIHLVAIGGSIMHNLAIALHKKGIKVTGSDDQIYEPAKSRLSNYGLLPDEGWNADRITPDLDLVILGMHAKPGNPELDKAIELGIPVVSFPEFLYQHSKDKKRVVIAGSHGKTTVTAMVMHVLNKAGFDFDYAVGSVIAGFEDSVRLSDSAELMIIEGDEYLSSALDRRPKFLHYHPHIALINGIAWDHINVFPTWEIYKDQFRHFIKGLQPGSDLVYFSGDNDVAEILEEAGSEIIKHPSRISDFNIEEGRINVLIEGQKFPISVFGRHNLQNLSGAQKICELLGISPEIFWKLVGDFKGAGKRLERIPNKIGAHVFRDFAHAPSKVKATVEAVKDTYPEYKLAAFLELHTFSSLNKNFITEYRGTLDKADEVMIFIDNHALKAKGGDQYTEDQVRKAFERNDIQLAVDAAEIKDFLSSNFKSETCLLMMSSGILGGVDLSEIIE